MPLLNADPRNWYDLVVKAIRDSAADGTVLTKNAASPVGVMWAATLYLPTGAITVQSFHALGNSDIIGDLAVQGLSSTTLANLTNVSLTAGRLQETQGANVAAANNLTLSGDGNAFVITGATTVNLLDSTGWQAGSVVPLYVATGLTFKHAFAVSGAFFPLNLSGNVDFVAAVGATLTLRRMGSTWHEIGRKT